MYAKNGFMYAKNGPRKVVKNFIYIFPHRILIYGIMPVFGQIARKSCREKDRVRAWPEDTTTWPHPRGRNHVVEKRSRGNKKPRS